MSLLLNEDFSTYALRLAYLTHMNDGVGERLIHLASATAVLNNPAFRASGWVSDNSAIRRCYSPPIPTTSAGVGVNSDYFKAPRRVTLRDEEGNGEVEGGGMVTGHQGSEDTIGAGLSERKRRRTRKEQLEEEDSSDLSDDSEDEQEKSAAQGIKFNKMPLRLRSKSSPPPQGRRKGELVDEDEEDGEDAAGPELMLTRPSKPPETGSMGAALQNRTRGHSFSSQVETVKQRARRDTTTSSDMSSENELDPNAFNRKLPGRPDPRVNKVVRLEERIQEEDDQRDGDSDLDDEYEDEDVGEASDLSDEFEVEVDAANAASPELGVMGMGVGGTSDDEQSPAKQAPVIPPPITADKSQGSPRKRAERELSLPKLPRLPPGRPISSLPPPSLLTAALKGGSSGADDKPFQRFAGLDGRNEGSPLWIKIYAPFSKNPSTPIEVPLPRRSKDGNPVTVAELIGLSLWRYNEEEFQPSLTADEKDSNINRWDLRIVDDEEVDWDFPALDRTKPVTDFSSNNNRPPQRRARDKPWDEFGLVRATDDQFKENEEMTPQIGTALPPTPVPPPPPPAQEQLRPAPAQRMSSEATVRTVTPTPAFNTPRNPITGTAFGTAQSGAIRKETAPLLDAPQRDPAAHSTPRTGAPKNITLHFTDPGTFATSTLNIPTTTDTYIAEIFDHGCHRLGLEKGLYVLKVHGTQTVAPSDRTVEALGQRLHLDLVRRRFGGGEGIFGLGLSGSPGLAGGSSASPNAPLELGEGMQHAAGSGGKRAAGGKKSAFAGGSSHMNLGLGLGLTGIGGLGDFGGRKYNVLRKQPLSFAPSHPRTLIITPEYMQILPAAPDSLAAPTGKVTNVPMPSIIGVKVSRKHPKMVRVLVYRDKETKRYDFEASGKDEAACIVADVRRCLEMGMGSRG